MNTKMINNFDLGMNSDEIQEIYLKEYEWNFIEGERYEVIAKLKDGFEAPVGWFAWGTFNNECKQIEKIMKKYRLSIKVIAELYIKFLKAEIIWLGNSDKAEIDTRTRTLIDRKRNRERLND